MKTITFTKNKLQELKLAFDEARLKKQEMFIFEGHPLLVAYAKYLIEYLDGHFTPVTKTVQEPSHLYRHAFKDNGK